MSDETAPPSTVQMDVPSSLVEVVQLIEALNADEGEPALEAELSINEWVGRIKGAAQEAHMFARTSQAERELRAWAQIAAIASRRIIDIRSKA